MGFAGRRLTRIAPTDANANATRHIATAAAKSFPAGGRVTRLMTTKTTDTAHIAQPSPARQRVRLCRSVASTIVNLFWLLNCAAWFSVSGMTGS